MKSLLTLLHFATLKRLLLASLMILNIGTTYAKSYAEHPQAKILAEQLEKEHNIAQTKTLRLLADAKKISKVIHLYTPKETKKRKSDWDRYKKQFVEPYRIEQGIQFWRENKQTLEEAELRFGVPASVIVAIIGVETLYGKHMGTDRVLDALATLSFDFPSGGRDRSPFFFKELGAFIVLTEQSNLDATQIKGSYAGAMGYGQFMPTSWQAYAVDGDNDGKIDLLSNRKDAIFSVANFLKQHGWRTGHAMLIPVEFKNQEHLKTLLAPDIVPTFTSQQMENKGLDLKQKTLENEKLALIELVRGDKQPTYYVGGQNFFVVTRYNRSSFYATAVLKLAETIEKEVNSSKTAQAKNE